MAFAESFLHRLGRILMRRRREGAVEWDEFTQSEILNYEAYSSVLAQYIWFDWGQELMGKYLAWKVRRKHARYVENMRRGAILRANGFIPPTNNRKAV